MALDQIILGVPRGADAITHRIDFFVSRPRIGSRTRTHASMATHDRSIARLLTLKQVDASTCRHVRVDRYKLNLPYHVPNVRDAETSIRREIIALSRAGRKNIRRKLKGYTRPRARLFDRCSDLIQPYGRIGLGMRWLCGKSRATKREMALIVIICKNRWILLLYGDRQAY